MVYMACKQLGTCQLTEDQDKQLAGLKHPSSDQTAKGLTMAEYVCFAYQKYYYGGWAAGSGPGISPLLLPSQLGQ